MKSNDLIGNVYGRLTVIDKAPYRNNNKCVLCKCTCGNNKIVRTNCLHAGDTRSCGCLQKEVLKMDGVKTHGKSFTRIYRIWVGMKQRCTNEKSSNFNYYGGGNIKICESWLDFDNFYRDMGQSYEDGLTLDRVDNEKGYFKENCKWRTYAQQNAVGRKRMYKSNTSGVVGVSFLKDVNKWEASISINKKHKSLGKFRTIELAIEARRAALIDITTTSD